MVLALDMGGYEEAPDMRSLRRPKQTVQPAKSRRMSEAKVSQKPGAVFVSASISLTFFASWWTNAYNAISAQKAINVRRAAKKDKSDEMRVTVTWVEKEKRKATNVTAVATG